MKNQRKKPFANKLDEDSTIIQLLKKYLKRIYERNYEDIWIIYDGLLEVAKQIENIKEKINKSK